MSFLESLGKDTYYMEEWAEVRIETCPKTGKVNEQPTADPYVQAVMLEADNIRLKLSKDNVDPVSVLASLSTPGVGFTYEQLKTFPVKPQEIIDASMGSEEAADQIPAHLLGEFPRRRPAQFRVRFENRRVPS